MITRADYLAGSLSRFKPWLAEGICRRTWERRQRKIAATSAPVQGTSAPRRRDLTRLRQEDLLLRHIHAYWDAQGITPSDPQALAKAIHSIRIPEPFKQLDGRALGKICRRVRKRLPAEYDRWVVLIEKWDKSYDRQKARDLIYRLVTAVGDRPPGILDRMFAHLERQICDHLPKKVRRLEYECKRLEKDQYYTPQHRSLKMDDFRDQVFAALAVGPKTKQQLARTFGKPYGAISSVGMRLRNEGLIKGFWREGKFMWGLASMAPPFIPARDAIVEALEEGPMTVLELAQATGKGTSTVKSALHRQLLAKGTVIRIKFGIYALAGTQPIYVSRADAIVAALKKGPKSFQELAREINNPPSSLPQFLEPLLAKRAVIRIKRGIYALRGSAPVYVATCDAIMSALAKQPMKLGSLIQHVNKSATSRSRSSIRSVLLRLKAEGTVKQDRRWGEYRLVRRAPSRSA